MYFLSFFPKGSLELPVLANDVPKEELSVRCTNVGETVNTGGPKSSEMCAGSSTDGICVYGEMSVVQEMAPGINGVEGEKIPTAIIPAAGNFCMQDDKLPVGENKGEEEDVVDDRPMTQRIVSDIENDNKDLGDDLVPVNKEGGLIRATMVLWTWSHTNKDHLQNPFDLRLNVTNSISESESDIEKSNIILCKHFALIISREWDFIRSDIVKKSISGGAGGGGV